MKTRKLVMGLVLAGALGLTACSTGEAVDIGDGAATGTGVLQAAIAGEPD